MIDRDDPATSVDVLLAEPASDERRLTRAGFDGGPSETTVHAVADGPEALAFLRRRGEHATAPRPHLVLLRLDLPGRSSGAVLEELRSETELARIPVVVYGNGATADEVRRVYDRFANAYVATPPGNDADAFVETMRRVRRFWVAAARLPGRGSIGDGRT